MTTANAQTANQLIHQLMTLTKSLSEQDQKAIYELAISIRSAAIAETVTSIVSRAESLR